MLSVELQGNIAHSALQSVHFTLQGQEYIFVHQLPGMCFILVMLSSATVTSVSQRFWSEIS